MCSLISRQCCPFFSHKPFSCSYIRADGSTEIIIFQTNFYISNVNRPNSFSLALFLFLSPQLQLLRWFSFCFVVIHLLQTRHWFPHVAKMCLDEGIKLLFLAVSLFGHLDTFSGMWDPKVHTQPSNWRFSVFFLHSGGPHTDFLLWALLQGNACSITLLEQGEISSTQLLVFTVFGLLLEVPPSRGKREKQVSWEVCQNHQCSLKEMFLE